MAASPDDLFRRLEDLGIETATVHHPAVFTVEESQNLCGEIAGAHSKNLFLKDKKGTVLLVVALEDADIDLKTFHKRADVSRLSFGKPDLLMQLLGVTPGAVTPFALINDTEAQVRVILDERMMAHEIVNYHPLTNEATTSITPDDLLKFLRSCGHEPAVIAVE
jgi:Ala-tRNA(Pro) deacylase